MRTLIVALGLVAASPVFSSEALAAPTAQQQQEIQAALQAVAQSEKELQEAIIAALDAQNPLPVSAQAKTDYATAKTMHGEAVALWNAKKYKDAYLKFREAAVKLEPAMNETLNLATIPQNVQDAGAKLVATDAKRVDALANAVATHASAEAKATYAEAKTLYAEAKTLWDGGKKRDAAVKAWESLKKADQAVKEMWQATAGAAPAAPAPAAH